MYPGSSAEYQYIPGMIRARRNYSCMLYLEAFSVARWSYFFRLKPPDPDYAGVRSMQLPGKQSEVSRRMYPRYIAVVHSTKVPILCTNVK